MSDSQDVMEITADLQVSSGIRLDDGSDLMSFARCLVLSALTRKTFTPRKNLQVRVTQSSPPPAPSTVPSPIAR